MIYISGANDLHIRWELFTYKMGMIYISDRNNLHMRWE